MTTARLSLLLSMLVLSSCGSGNQMTTPPVPTATLKRSFRCEDLKPRASFSWATEGADTLIILTMQIKYDGPCIGPDGGDAWIGWPDITHSGISEPDRSYWTRVQNGRLEASSSMGKHYWSAADSIVVMWGIVPLGTSECFDTLFHCQKTITLVPRDILPRVHHGPLGHHSYAAKSHSEN